MSLAKGETFDGFMVRLTMGGGMEKLLEGGADSGMKQRLMRLSGREEEAQMPSRVSRYMRAVRIVPSSMQDGTGRRDGIKMLRRSVERHLAMKLVTFRTGQVFTDVFLLA